MGKGIQNNKKKVGNLRYNMGKRAGGDLNLVDKKKNEKS